MSASTENLSSWRLIFKSTALLMKSHSYHFYALSIIFLLPIFLTLVIYPCFHLALFHPDYHFTSFTKLQPHISLSSFEIIIPLVYTLFTVLLFLCAVATITHSAVHAYHDRPINLVSSIKSIRNSFFPLISTFIVSQTIFISIILVFSLVFIFSVQVLESFGLLELKYDEKDSNNFLFLVIVGLIMLVPVLIWLQVNWSLGYVIAVVESKYGFETLRKSAYLVKGKRGVALLMMLLYGLLMGSMVVCGSMFVVIVGAAKANEWRSLGVILQTMESSVMGFLMMNQYLVGNVVFYMYCKDFNGEKMPLEIGDKFAGAGEYVSLPLDDEKNHGNV